MHSEQFDKVSQGQGFIAALDQSGGSTPKALAAYGVEADAYSNDDEMFDRIHEMRSRIMTSDAFTGERVLGAILFEKTMDREVEGKGSAQYLWDVKNIVPFLKVDKGLADEVDGAQVMKPMPDLDALLDRAVDKGVFGTKMRSVVKVADQAGVDAVLDQQFAVGAQIAAKGLVPILEPEVDINSPSKAEAEQMLHDGIIARLESAGDDKLMFKVTLPETDGLYADVAAHPNVVGVVALSGGYSRDEANARLARNTGVIASFSRALTQDLSAHQSDDEFEASLDEAIESIYRASIT
ncbi:MAG: fructose bisphosphate aldolase [Acidimicrobiales bacterium]|nr:fructose bisphosphate aldolase [Acidimicrobiales bacterium]